MKIVLYRCYIISNAIFIPHTDHILVACGQEWCNQASDLCENSATDKVLSVVVAAVSALLHSRPITHLSINIEDPEPLTPNHFLFTQVLPYCDELL